MKNLAVLRKQVHELLENAVEEREELAAKRKTGQSLTEALTELFLGGKLLVKFDPNRNELLCSKVES